MTFHPLPELADVVFAERANAYERWLAEAPGTGDYLFSDARVRFDARDGDVLLPAPGLACEAISGGARVHVPALGRSLELFGVSAEALLALVDALDGERTLAAARDAAKLDRSGTRALLDATFGLVLFAPLAVAELERALPAHEIVRFPGSPYEIPRDYWWNVARVREKIPTLVERLKQPLRALDELRRLHAITLLGEGRTFYRPASPIAQKGLFPGRLWLAPSRTVETDVGTRFLEGPRVNATLLGGDAYGALVAEAAGDPEGARERRELHDEQGLSWGRVTLGRAEGDAGDAVWFCPPRPLSVEHVESLFESLERALAAARGAMRSDAVAHAADFHRKFVRLHPFRAANQSLAMNVTNFALSLATEGAGAPGSGIPHLVLDHLALRLAPEAYRRVFSLAVSEWRYAGSPAARTAFFAEKKRRAFELVTRLVNAPDRARAVAEARSDPEGARAALVVAPPEPDDA